MSLSCKPPIFTIISRKNVPISSFQDYIDRCHISWYDTFQSAKNELLHIWNYHLACDKYEYEFFPPIEDVFTAFDLTPPENIKVVILGQDPYHDLDKNGEPHACGLAFSVRSGQTIPSSLKNIFKEIQEEYPEEERKITSGSLRGWAKQGVFLLNTALTVAPGQPNIHKGKYLGFIKMVIDRIRKENKDCIWLLWGNEAKSAIGSTTGHILTSTHPSGFSYSNSKYGQSFKGNGHFRQVNEILEKQGRSPINWFANE